MQTKLLCQKYLNALNEGSLEVVLSLFEEGAIVHSPLYGETKAESFYQELFADTSKSVTQLIQTYEPTDGSLSCAMLFHYQWTLTTGKVVEFDCMDVFELNQEQTRFTKLKIIYDTAFLRSDFAKSHKRSQ